MECSHTRTQKPCPCYVPIHCPCSYPPSISISSILVRPPFWAFCRHPGDCSHGVHGRQRRHVDRAQQQIGAVTQCFPRYTIHVASIVHALVSTRLRQTFCTYIFMSHRPSNDLKTATLSLPPLYFSSISYTIQPTDGVTCHTLRNFFRISKQLCCQINPPARGCISSRYYLHSGPWCHR